MARRSPGRVIAGTLALTVLAHAADADPSVDAADTMWMRPIYGKGPGPAEQLGPQFIFAWDENQQATAAMALRDIEGKLGIDDILMNRQRRILGKLTYRRVMWVGPNGEEWLPPIQLTLPEIILTGFSLSRYYCSARDQDTDDLDEARAYCENTKKKAQALMRTISAKALLNPHVELVPPAARRNESPQ